MPYLTRSSIVYLVQIAKALPANSPSFERSLRLFHLTKSPSGDTEISTLGRYLHTAWFMCDCNYWTLTFLCICLVVRGPNFIKKTCCLLFKSVFFFFFFSGPIMQEWLSAILQYFACLWSSTPSFTKHALPSAAHTLPARIRRLWLCVQSRRVCDAQQIRVDIWWCLALSE